MTVDAATASGLSFGVEEEFLLVDPTTARTVGVAQRVLAAAAELPPAAVDATLQAELLQAQVEAATGRCTSLAELAGQLAHGRRQLGAAARDCGAWLVSSGTPVLAARVPVTDGPRFRLIAQRYREIVRDYQVCGCHVHVGVPDRVTAVAVVNHLRPWLPTLLAVSVNSPYRAGVDTGYGSWRMVEQSRFPGSGVPPWFDSVADHEATVAGLVHAGVLVDDRMTFWLARPSPRLPTVELRVADPSIDVDGALLQAALSRGLVRTALAELAAGRTAPRVPDQLAATAVWSAARYGLDGPGVHPVTGRQVPADALLDELLEHLRPALAETGDLPEVSRLIRGVRRTGTGAHRQRGVRPAEPVHIVRMLAGRTTPDLTVWERHEDPA